MASLLSAHLQATHQQIQLSSQCFLCHFTCSYPHGFPHNTFMSAWIPSLYLSSFIHLHYRFQSTVGFINLFLSHWGLIVSVIIKPFVWITSSSCTPTLILPLVALLPILLCFWIISEDLPSHISSHSVLLQFLYLLALVLFLGSYQTSLRLLFMTFQVGISSFCVYFIFIDCSASLSPSYSILFWGNYPDIFIGGITLFWGTTSPPFCSIQWLLNLVSARGGFKMCPQILWHSCFSIVELILLSFSD